jgi:dienelactone hydrolase
MSRRKAIALFGAGCCGLSCSNRLPSHTLRAAERGSPGARPLNRFPRMVQEYFVQRVRRAERDADRVRNELKTRGDAERYVQAVRRRILASFGPLPARTPLNPRISGVVERDAYKIEKIIFESRPDFLVTANLYIPKGGKFPLPGVVGTCGHSANGKAYESYQSFAQGLARMGYVVLIYDPLGQGERSQYPDDHPKPGYGEAVAEHLRAGNQQFLVGEFLGTWRAWDGIRALDYLLTRAEVDPRHVGVTGNSGGGTMTTWLCGLGQRWTMAAPSCFVTTFRRNLENELPADTEQCPPRALALGLDHSDFLAALAPRPVLILAQEKDYFDVRGTLDAYARLKRLYGLLGAEQNIALFVGPREHGYSRESREAMYRWFNRATGISQAAAEPKLLIEKDETLWCAPGGQVAKLKSRSVFSFTKSRARELRGARRPLNGKELAQSIAQVLRLPPRKPAPDYRILRPVSERKYPKAHCVSYAVETEPAVHALVHLLSDRPHLSRPPQQAARAILYVAHYSSDQELREETLIPELLKAEPESAFYACDVRGIGDSRPDTCGSDQFLQPYGSDYFYAIHGIMLDYPYLGQRTHDVLQVLDWLAAAGHREVHLAAKGWGTLPAAFAALLAPLVVQVTLKNAPTSYSEIAESETYAWPLSSFLPGVLEHFDLPDCYRGLSTKRLRQIEPCGALALPAWRTSS